MSEEARIGYLKEKIKEANRNSIVGGALVVLSVIAFLVGLLEYLLSNQVGDANFGLVSVIIMMVGVALLVVGLAGVNHYNCKRKELLNQLKEIGTEKTPPV